MINIKLLKNSFQLKMKFFFMICIVFSSQFVFAASYFSVGNGNISLENLSFDANMQEEVVYSESSGFSLEIGHFLTNSVALEIGFLAAKFKKEKIEYSTPSAFTAEIEGGFTAATMGLRWFLYEFMNIRFGAIRREYDPNLKATGALDDSAGEKKLDYGNFYGAGLGATFENIQIYFDQTTIVNPNGKNGDAKLLGLRLFF